MKKLNVCTKIFFIFLILFGCTNSKKPVEYKIKGSTNIVKAIKEVLPNFIERYPHLSLKLEAVEDARAIASYLDGTTDFAIATRMFNVNENNYAISKKKQVQPYAIASDSVALIVHNLNPLNNLKLASVKKILSFKITEWSDIIKQVTKDLTLTNKPAELKLFLESSNYIVDEKLEVCVLNNLYAIHSYLLGLANIRFFNSKIKLFVSEKALINYVSKKQNAIGFVSSISDTEKCKRIKVNGVEISPENIINKKYPLVRKYYFFIPRNYRNIEMIDFIFYLRSPFVRKSFRNRGLTRP